VDSIGFKNILLFKLLAYTIKVMMYNY